MQNRDFDDKDALPQRIALLSIIGFWAFYLAILTARALFIYQAHVGFLNRCMVSLASIGVTYLVYLVLRRVPVECLRRSIVTAALISLPAAFTYSTINWAVFSRDMKAPSTTRTRVFVVRRPAIPALPTTAPPASGSEEAPSAPPAPPAPPAAPQAITVGKVTTAADEEDEISPLLAITDQAANGYFFFICWAALYLALNYAHRVGALERRAALLAAAAQSAEIRALRYQVNPHFLFNTLNSLSSLVLAGKRDEAERMIIGLSTFFRTSLTGDPTADLPLAEEIRMQRLYLDIETVRFPSRLRFEIDVPPELRSACVPGLVLQPLVENAVKHGVSRTREPVTIRIAAREDGDFVELSVSDDAVASAGQGSAGTGIGLTNVRDRLAARFGEDAGCSWGPLPEGGFRVTLRFPLVHES